jgi:methylmalonyl-CoA/ethylmalonyl-CoA epimerase
MNLSAIDHVGVAVDDLDAAVERYRAQFGVTPAHRERVLDQGVEEVMIEVGDSFIQLLGALGPDTPVGRYLQRNGPGLHHVAYRVDDLEAALEELSSQSVRLIDEHGRAGSRGTRIAFVHPAAAGGVLTELVQTSPK